jgi:hypothetical protein
MVTNGHQPGEEPGWDAALLDAWRTEALRAGVHYLEVLPGKPRLAFDLSGASQLIVQGRMANPLLRRGQELMEAQRHEAEESAGLDVNEAERRFWEMHDRVREWQDAVISCAWVSPPNPPWCRLYDLPPGAPGGAGAAGEPRHALQPAERPAGAFCLDDIQPPARRRMLVDLIIGGTDALQTFRDESARLDAASHGARLRTAPVDLPPAEPSAGSALPVRRGDLVERDDRGAPAPGRAAGADEPGHRPADAPDPLGA